MTSMQVRDIIKAKFSIDSVPIKVNTSWSDDYLRSETDNSSECMLKWFAKFKKCKFEFNNFQCSKRCLKDYDFEKQNSQKYS